MAAATPTTEPESIVAGDSLVFNKTLADYPASEGWSLSYSLLSQDGNNFYSFNASASGQDYAVSVPAATTGTWLPGNYSAQAKVSLVAAVHTVWIGQIVVKPCLTAAAGDTRSHARIVLDNIEAVLEKRATREILNSMVAGQRLERIPVADLLVLRDRYRIEVGTEVNAERISQGLGTRRRILTRFSPQGGANTIWQGKPWQ